MCNAFCYNSKKVSFERNVDEYQWNAIPLVIVTLSRKQKSLFRLLLSLDYSSYFEYDKSSFEMTPPPQFDKFSSKKP